MVQSSLDPLWAEKSEDSTTYCLSVQRRMLPTGRPKVRSSQHNILAFIHTVKIIKSFN
jgi:hypothetical protein